MPDEPDPDPAARGEVARSIGESTAAAGLAGLVVSAVAFLAARLARLRRAGRHR